MSNDGFHSSIARSTFWAFASSWSRMVISLGAFVLIARLIGPESFGHNAMAGACASLCQVLVGSAMGEGLVQREDLSQGILSAWFWVLQAIGLVVFVALVVSRGAIAGIYDEPMVGPLIAAYAGLIPLAALQTVPEALLMRRLDFRSQALATAVGVSVGSGLGIGLALGGAGPWALAALQVSQAAVTAAIIAWRAGWAPDFSPDWSPLPGLCRYSASAVGVRLLVEIDNQIPRMLIGKVLGPVPLGLYSVARRIFDLLKDALVVPFQAVALPSLAGARSAGKDVSTLFGTAVGVSLAIANPTFLGLLVVAPLLVPVLFGQEWLAAVPVLQWLALVGLRLPVSGFNGAAMRASGKPHWQVTISAAGAALCVVLVYLAAPYGLIVVAVAIVVRSYVLWPVSAVLVERLGVYPARAQFSIGTRSLVAAGIMAAITWGLGRLLAGRVHDAIALAACVAAGVLLYPAAYYALAPRETRESLAAARRLLSRAKPAPDEGAGF